MHKAICMIAYATYFTDARIKNYVVCLLGAGYEATALRDEGWKVTVICPSGEEIPSASLMPV